MKTIVIGDIHGDSNGLVNILRATGAVEDGKRVPETRVIQLGDLIHGGTPRGVARAGVDDATALMLGLEYCDEILIGNHELPLVWPDAGFPTWGGQRPLAAEARAALVAAYRGRVLVPATSVGDWLLTHAGLLPAFQRHDRNAAETVEHLGSSFRYRAAHRTPVALFDGVGRERGGTHARGGIFWVDWSVLINASASNPVKQIVGHTPQKAGYAHVGPYWCIDANAALSGKVSALVSDDEGGTWEPVVTTAAPPDAARHERGGQGG